MNEDRIIDLESQLLHQEHTVAKLNEALVDQQAQIARLEASVDALMDRVRALSQTAAPTADDDQPPPHY